MLTGIIDLKIECSGSFKDKENSSEMMKKTTISKAEISHISLLPIIFKQNKIKK